MQEVVYDLVAVCNHHGSATATGHYTANCRLPDGCWYCFDDEVVRPISEAEVVTAKAYLLFFTQQG